METLKPGTRCECLKYGECPHTSYPKPNNQNLCPGIAVRRVTVNFDRVIRGRKELLYPRTVRVRMCEPCAQFHEAKAVKS